MRRFLKSRRKRKRRLSIIVGLVFYFSSKVNAVPIPGADGFACRPSNQHITRSSTSISTVLKEHPNNENKPNENNVSYYDSELNSIFEDIQLQRKYKHSPDFGIYGNYNLKNKKLFRQTLIDHMKSVTAIDGTFHGDPVYHYLDKNTRLNVMVNKTTKKFISGWKTSEAQCNHIINGGKL